MGSSGERIKSQVKKSYADIARAADSGSSAGCCGPSTLMGILDTGKKIDYSVDQLALGPGQANLGLGCGNPLSMAELKKGEVVLDLGSGAGFDALLAAKEVGKRGRVIGIDMTPEMIERATRNANTHRAWNVEFRLGDIENLPVESETIDVVISNCVINLSPDKESVYGGIFRVLKPGGRIVISDVLRSGELPEKIIKDPAAYVGWIAGAISPGEVRNILDRKGFEHIVITRKDNSEEIIEGWNVAPGSEKLVFSAYIRASKPLKIRGERTEEK